MKLKSVVAKNPIKWRARPPLVEQIPALEEWFASPQGVEFIAREQLLVNRALKNSFGYHLLQLGMSRNHQLYADCGVQQRSLISPIAGNANTQLLAEFDQLPFASDSIDVAIAHHVLEFAENPHHVLRELQRVIMPNGRLIIIGSNPHSLFNLGSTARRLLGDSVWNNHWLTSRRCLDWLSLLGFEKATTRYACMPLPIKLSAMKKWIPGMKADVESSTTAKQKNLIQSEWRQRFPFGAIYVIDVVKQVSPYTPIKLKKTRSLAELVDFPLTRPAPTRFKKH